MAVHTRGGGEKFNRTPPMEIIAVVANSKWDDARSDIVPFLYMPYSQDKNLGHLAFYVRTERDPSPMAAVLRSLVQRLDPNLPVNNLRTLGEQVSNSMRSEEHTSELQSRLHLVCRLLLEKKKNNTIVLNSAHV